MQTTPAILPHSFDEIGEKLSRIEGLVERVQIDICDGVFGLEKTWYPSGSEKLPAGFTYEFDVMVRDWKHCVEKCLQLKPAYLVAHVDELTDVELVELVGMVKEAGVMLGIAVSNDKEVDYLVEMVRRAQELYTYNKVYIQVMGIARIGEQAQSFDPSCIDRIIAIKSRIGDVEMQVDGGMKPDTAKEVMKAGAMRAICGSYIFGTTESYQAYQNMTSIGELAGSYEE
jgi:ribulose-phosphate 3-epimerase